MEDKHEADKVDDVMLPGFRFHPTDEELVAFYLRRKILQQSLPIELIRQLDIYKFDPWDLPKLAATGEKEWYFYCPRDRKYRNSARPNRVTGAGFWKATGTDRPIYSSDGTKCVGLKKSLVFYRGRAAKGIKTDWMMHEFRLPSVSDSIPSKKLLDRGIPLNDSWVICRIFKKTTSVAQRALSYPWIAQAHEPAVSPTEPLINQDNTSCTTTELGSTAFTASLDYPFYKLISQTASRGPMISASTRDLQANSLIFPALDMSVSLPKSSIDTSYSSLLLNLSPAFPPNAGKAIDFGGSSQQQMINGFPITSLLDLQGNMAAADGAATNPGGASTRSSTSTGFPFMFPTLSWESPPCPSEMSTGYSSNKCYS